MTTALTEIPAGWKRVPLRYLTRNLDHLRVPKNAAERAEMPGMVPYWGANSIQGYVDRALITGRNVLVGEDGAPFFDPLASVAFAVDGPIWPNNHVHVLRPNADVDFRFLAACLNAVDYSLYVKGSTRDKLNQSELSGIVLAVPAYSEQRELADFLDRETAEIDAFIADQEELIGLLAERRAATISHAVTKGLDPTVPMKDSGVEWLGHVPAHWVVARIASSVASVKNGVWGDDPRGTSDIRCIRVADFDRSSQRIHDRDVTYREIPEAEKAARILHRGDLLLEKSGGGDKSPVGFVVLYDRDEPAVTSNFVARVRLRPQMEPRFWTYVHNFFYSRRLTVRSVKQSTGIQNLDQSSYFNEPFVIPAGSEQSAIADHLDRETAELDAAIADAREAIALSRERRAALISAAVTGKIDVREAA